MRTQADTHARANTPIHTCTHFHVNVHMFFVYFHEKGALGRDDTKYYARKPVLVLRSNKAVSEHVHIPTRLSDPGGLAANSSAEPSFSYKYPDYSHLVRLTIWFSVPWLALWRRGAVLCSLSAFVGAAWAHGIAG